MTTLQSPRRQPEPGSVALLRSKTHIRLVLAGELDLATNDELTEAVQEVVRYGRPIEVDARHVTFMDSLAFAALARLVHFADHRTVFISPPDVIRFLLQVTGIGELVDIVENDEASRDTTAVEHSASVTPTH